ncbi:MAG: hypothetical protein ACYC2X_06780 [Coriobacteriia bacterium]|jgi:hypothetical protein
MDSTADVRVVKTPRRVARGIVITGALMAVLGPALALGTLLSVSTGLLPDTRPVSDVLAVLHVGGLIAGVVGAALVVALALQWLFGRVLRRTEEAA